MILDVSPLSTLVVTCPILKLQRLGCMYVQLSRSPNSSSIDQRSI